MANSCDALPFWKLAPGASYNLQYIVFANILIDLQLDLGSKLLNPA